MYADPYHLPVSAYDRAEIAPERFALRDERQPVELLVRYAWRGLRGTVMLKDLTRNGARIEGLEPLRQGDGLTLLLPDLPAMEATVAWASGRAAGLRFDGPIAADALDRLVLDFGPDGAVAPGGIGPTASAAVRLRHLTAPGMLKV